MRCRLRKRVAPIGVGLCVCLAVLSPFATAQFQSFRERTATGQSVTNEHDGIEREYRIYVLETASRKQLLPLVVFLHRGGGNFIQGSKAGLTPLADQHEFIAVYPGAVNKNWNNGRMLATRFVHDRAIDGTVWMFVLSGPIS